MNKVAPLACVLVLGACGDAKKESNYFGGSDAGRDASAPSDAGRADAGALSCGIPDVSPIEILDSSKADCKWDLNDPCGPGRYCQTFQDVPVQASARCTEGDASSPKTRLLGTVFDFGALVCSGALVPATGAEVRFAPALEAATDAESAWTKPLSKTLVDERGRFDISTDLTGTTLGVLGLVGGGEYARSANGVAVVLPTQPEGCSLCYGEGSDAHDLFAIPQTLLTTWSEALASDNDYIKARLPLGKRGGTLGLVRVLETGEPLAGVSIESEIENGTGQVRYLEEDLRSFSQKVTTKTGAFVVVGPSLAQGFNAVIKGKKLTVRPNLAGTTPGSVLVMLYNIRQADLP